MRRFDEKGARPLLIKVMKVMGVLEKYGYCPSMSLGPRDPGSGELYTKKVLLATITLPN